MASPYEADVNAPTEKSSEDVGRAPQINQRDRLLLSICIPTRNRAARTYALVDHLIYIIEPYGSAIELIVSDNSTTNDTFDRLVQLKSDRLRLHRQAMIHATAEAHVFAATELCRGTYVWFLGDDDIPVPETLAYALGLLETGEHDFLFFNSALIDEISGLTGGSVTRQNAALLRFDFVKAALAIGLMSAFAGLSNSIMRRDRLGPDVWREFPERSIIYAHVAWWLVCFADGMMTMVNRPLVFYRVADGAETFGRFQALALELGWPDHHFWGEGLVDLLLFMERRGVLNATDIAGMFESRRDGGFGRALDDIAYAIFRQAAESVAPVGDRNRISGPTLDLLTDWLERIDPSFHECVQVLHHIHALRPDPAADPGRFELQPPNPAGQKSLPDFENEFRRLHAHIAARNTPLVGLVSFSGPFRIFRHLSGYVAMRDDLVATRQDVLRTIDPVSEQGGIVVAPSLPLAFEALANLPRTSTLKAPEHAPPPVAPDLRLSVLTAERDAALFDLDAMRNSTIWLATAPLRKIISALRSA